MNYYGSARLEILRIALGAATDQSVKRLDYRLDGRDNVEFLLSVRKNTFLRIVEREYDVHPPSYPMATGVSVQGLKTSGGNAVAVHAMTCGAVDV
jgi:hypothetical protein